MVSAAIRLSYEGGDANNHTIDARYFGQSLQGIGRMVSDCLFIFAFERLPKRNETVPLILKVREPREGSYDVPGLYQEVSSALGFGIPIITTIGPDILSHYVTAVIDKFRGKDDVVDLAIRTMAEMHQASLNVIAQVEANRHIEQMAMQDMLRTAIAGSGRAAVDYVAPVGRSVDSARFAAGEAPSVTVNAEDADTIRESQKLDWSPLGEEILRTDGFRFHTNGLSVENPDGGFLMAEVNDPVFEEESNPYTVAAGKRGIIAVTARIGRKNDRIARIQIVEFKREIDDNPS